jgi:hypothetical protein
MNGEPSFNLPGGMVMIPLGFFRELLEAKYGGPTEPELDTEEFPVYNEVQEPVFEPWEELQRKKPRGPYLKRQGPMSEGTSETSEGSGDPSSGD